MNAVTPTPGTTTPTNPTPDAPASGGTPAAGPSPAGNGAGGPPAAVADTALPGGKPADQAPAAEGGTEPPKPASPASIVNPPKEADALKAPPTWPEDWRTKLAAGDEKELKRLERFGSPEDIAKAYRELEAKFSRGEFKKPLAPDATPEQIAAFRKDNGIPETPDKYEIKLNDGRVVGEQDKPLVNAFVAAMHEKNATPDQVNSALDTYYKMVTERQAAQVVMFNEAATSAKMVLNQEWGNEFGPNVNAIQGLMDTMPAGAGKHILEGFGADGVPLLSNPDVARALLSWAKQINPTFGLHLPGGGTDAASLASRKSELVKMSGDHSSPYWQGANAQKLQQELRDINGAELIMKKHA